MSEMGITTSGLNPCPAPDILYHVSGRPLFSYLRVSIQSDLRLRGVPLSLPGTSSSSTVPHTTVPLAALGILKHVISVKSVPQYVANLVHRADGQEDHQPTKDGQPGRRLGLHGERASTDVAPARRSRRDAPRMAIPARALSLRRCVSQPESDVHRGHGVLCVAVGADLLRPTLTDRGSTDQHLDLIS